MYSCSERRDFSIVMARPNCSQPTKKGIIIRSMIQLIRAQARQNRDFSRFSPQPLLFHTQLCHHNVVLSSPPMAIGHGGLKLILIQEGRSLACILQALHSAQLCGTQMHPVRPYEGLLPSRFLTPMVLLFLAPAVRLFMTLEINDRCFAASD